MSDNGSIGITEVRIGIERETDGARTRIAAGAWKVVVAVVDTESNIGLACADYTAAGARELARDLEAEARKLEAAGPEDLTDDEEER